MEDAPCSTSIPATSTHATATTTSTGTRAACFDEQVHFPDVRVEYEDIDGRVSNIKVVRSVDGLTDLAVAAGRDRPPLDLS